MIKWPMALAIQPRTGLYPRCELIALAGYQREVNMILSFVIQFTWYYVLHELMIDTFRCNNMEQHDEKLSDQNVYFRMPLIKSGHY